MTNINNATDSSDPYFYLAPSSSSVLTTATGAYKHQKRRKKRTKLIKVEPIVGPSTTTSASSSKPKYHAKKPDPSSPKITRPCSECGKKFWSWEALFGHMRCHPERQWRGINPPPNYNRKPIDSPPHVFVVKKQRSTSIGSLGAVGNANDDRCSASLSSLDEVAECLLLLANSNISDGCDVGGSSFDGKGGDQEDETTMCRFECPSCKKVFGSHQALGGHRASHKNVKGCFAITRTCSSDQDHEEVENSVSGIVLGGGYHKCDICMKVFTSGQALGGHKRCHWEKLGEEASSSTSMLIDPQQLQLLQGQQRMITNAEKDGKVGEGSNLIILDLNLPALVQDHHVPSSSYSSSLNLDLRLGL